MATIYYETLTDEVQQNIKEKNYSLKQLTELHEVVKKQYSENKSGFMRLLVVFAIIIIFMAVVTYMSMAKMPNANMTVMAVTMIAMVAACVLVLLYLKNLKVDKVRNQFVRLVTQNYPEYAAQFGKDSFK